MSVAYLNQQTLSAVSSDFASLDRPVFWNGAAGILTDSAFETLVAEFPDLSLFEKHEGLPRANGQRPHDRYYLGYKSSPYRPAGYRGEGIAFPEDLSPAWRGFLDEIEGPTYRAFLGSVLGTSDVILRCAWHMGMSGAEVSPHRDSLQKKSIHLFYFNPVDDWDRSWGGELQILKGCKLDRENPDFGDFEEVVPIETVGNRSLFLRNAADAWHGVKPLDCPDGQYRRLFTVIAQAPPSLRRKATLRARRMLGLSYPGES